MSQSRENLRTDGRTDGRTDRPYFIEPFQPTPGVQKSILLSTVKNFDSKFMSYIDFWLTKIISFGDTSLDVNTNSSILSATIDFVLSSKWFEGPPFWNVKIFFSSYYFFTRFYFAFFFPWDIIYGIKILLAFFCCLMRVPLRYSSTWWLYFEVAFVFKDCYIYM